MVDPIVQAEYNFLSVLYWYGQDAIAKNSEEIFYDSRARKIFTELKRQQEKGEKLDFIHAAMTAGIPAYDATEMLSAGSGENPNAWEITVKGNYLNRMQNRIFTESKGITDGLERIQYQQREFERVLDLIDGTNIAADSHEEFLADLERARKGEDTLISTGFIALDKWFGGYEEGDFVLVAARPSVGKTAFGCSKAYNIARFKGTRVDFHSYEMQAKRIRRRVITRMTHIDNKRLRQARVLTPDQYDAAVKASYELNKYPLRLFYSSELNVSALANEIHRTDAKIIIVDYLGLVPPTKAGSKKEEITDVSNKLRDAAKKSGKVVIALVQMNREQERQNRRPVLSDLRDSGELEQDADIVLFLHEPQRRENIDHGLMDVEMEIVGEKIRDGEVSVKKLRFDKRYSHFYDEADHMPEGVPMPPMPMQEQVNF